MKRWDEHLDRLPQPYAWGLAFGVSALVWVILADLAIGILR